MADAVPPGDTEEKPFAVSLTEKVIVKFCGFPTGITSTYLN